MLPNIKQGSTRNSKDGRVKNANASLHVVPRGSNLNPREDNPRATIVYGLAGDCTNGYFSAVFYLHYIYILGKQKSMLTPSHLYSTLLTS